MLLWERRSIFFVTKITIYGNCDIFKVRVQLKNLIEFGKTACRLLSLKIPYKQ